MRHELADGSGQLTSLVWGSLLGDDPLILGTGIGSANGLPEQSAAICLQSCQRSCFEISRRTLPVRYVFTVFSAARRWSGTLYPAVDLAGEALPLILSLTAGSTDIIGFLGLNGLFTAHITGNLVVLAAHIVAGDPTIFSYILSVPVFMVILFLTRLLAGSLEQARVSPLHALLLLHLLLLAAFLWVCVVWGPWRDGNEILAVAAGMLGVAAMAVQNAIVQISLKSTPNTAAMTTNITHFVLDLGGLLVRRDDAGVAQARARAMHTFPAIVGFTIGCVFGAAFEAAAGLWSLALPTGLALVASAVSFAGRNRPS